MLLRGTPEPGRGAAPDTASDTAPGAALEATPEAALDMALASAMLRRVSRGGAGPMLRVYRPTSRVVAFGRRDVRLAGFSDAVSAVRRAGFSPCVRASGGRAVAYTTDALVVDHVSPDPQWPSGLEDRFAGFGDLWAGVLGRFGVDARVGEVPGEYCPGSHSVNARGTVKLVGTAQRMVRGAWLFSAVLVVDGAPELRPLLRDVYAALELPFDDASVGALAEEAPSASLDAVESAVLDAYAARWDLTPAPFPEGLAEAARLLLREHSVPG